jgi:hypothetical protein
VRADVLARVGPERVPRPEVAPAALTSSSAHIPVFLPYARAAFVSDSRPWRVARHIFITMGAVPCRVSGHNDDNSPAPAPSSLLALAETHTGDSTTSGEDAQSPRRDRSALTFREIKIRAPAAAPGDDANASAASPTSIGSVVDERVAVTPMPLPSPSHRATTARATQVHFAPPMEETNS